LAFCGYKQFFTAENAEGAEKRQVENRLDGGKSRKSPRSLRSLRFNLFFLSRFPALLKKGQTSRGRR
jgi:hypothetical protein